MSKELKAFPGYRSLFVKQDIHSDISKLALALRVFHQERGYYTRRVTASGVIAWLLQIAEREGYIRQDPETKFIIVEKDVL